MSQWDERIKNHPVWTALKEVESTLASVEPEDHEEIVDVERLRQVIRHVRPSIEQSDPSLIPQTAVENLRAALTRLQAELGAYTGNRNRAHLTNANEHADGALVALGAIPTFDVISDVDAAREAITSFRRSAAQHMRRLEEEYERLGKDMTGLRVKSQELVQTIDQQKARLDKAISQFQQQFSAAESQRQQQFSTRSEAQDAEFRETLEKTRNTLLEQQSAFESQLAKQRDDSKSESDANKLAFSQLLTDSKTDLDNRAEQFAENAEGHIDAMEDFRQQAEKLVGVITNVGMIGGYQKNANSARKQGWVWQTITVLSIGGLIGFAIWAFVGTQEGDFSWVELAGRAFAAVTFAVLTAFGVRQSEKHYDTERRDRNKELELAAIGPYLNTLPEEKQWEIKEELARRLFGQQTTLLPELIKGKSIRGPKGSQPDALIVLAELLRDVLVKK